MSGRKIKGNGSSSKGMHRQRIADQFLYNSSGDGIALRVGKNIFDTDGNWIGWMPWNNSYVLTPNGGYIGTICKNNRFYHFSYFFRSKKYRDWYPGRYPSYLGYPGYPGYAGYSPLPLGAENIKNPKKE